MKFYLLCIPFLQILEYSQLNFLILFVSFLFILKDNIKIRVGGGYLSIDEFLDQYTTVELEKLERKDPLKRFSEKFAI